MESGFTEDRSPKRRFLRPETALRSQLDGLGIGFGDDIAAAIGGIGQNRHIASQLGRPGAEDHCQQSRFGCERSAQERRTGYLAQLEVVADDYSKVACLHHGAKGWVENRKIFQIAE